MNQPRPKIVHVITESGPFGGAQRNTLLTLQGLIRDGYPSELICGPGGPLVQEAQAVGVPVHVISGLVRPLDPLRDCRTFLQLYRLFRTKKYSIVHTHSVKAGLLGRLAAYWARIPVIVHTLHGVPLELNGSLQAKVYIAMERFLGSYTHALPCVGDALRQELVARQIAPKDKLVTIYSGIDFSSYAQKRTPDETKRQLGVEGAWPIVGCVGRLSEQKAQYYLIEAFALLKDKWPHSRLLLVGEGELRPQLEKRIQELSLSSSVSLLGERDDIADLLNIFDIYAMCSLWEGVGRALTEAMYWGLPIVATPVNGVKEFILHEETGLLVPQRDPTALSAAITRLATDRELARRVGANAQQKARDVLDGQRMIKDTEQLYERLNPRSLPSVNH